MDKGKQQYDTLLRTGGMDVKTESKLVEISYIARV
jgi:hypothetical protein